MTAACGRTVIEVRITAARLALADDRFGVISRVVPRGKDRQDPG
jgi:hypothetical protein